MKVEKTRRSLGAAWPLGSFSVVLDSAVAAVVDLYSEAPKTASFAAFLADSSLVCCDGDPYQPLLSAALHPTTLTHSGALSRETSCGP